jgi:hypothetical protein
LSWLSDLLPDNLRGRVISARNGILILVAICADFLLSQVREELGVGLKDRFFLICIAVASLAGLKSIFAFRNQWEPSYNPAPVPRLGDVLKKVFTHPGLRPLVWALSLWNIAVGVAIAFWAPHMLTYLNLPFTTIFLYSSIVTICSFFMSRWIWGGVIDRAGTLSVVLFCTILISIIPVLWLFISPENLSFFWFEAVLSGLAWSGFNVAIFNLPFVILPQKNRSYYFAIISAFSGVSLGLGAIVGGGIAQLLAPIRIELFGMTYINYHATFVISAILRACCLLLMRKIPDRRSHGMVFMLKMVGDGLVRLRTNPRLLFFLRFNRLKDKEKIKADRLPRIENI